MTWDILYLDCPWRYNARNNQHTRFGPGVPYDTLSYPDMRVLPIGDLAARYALLFLWATPPYLPQQIQVAQAWGFTYKTWGFLWEKVNTDGSPRHGTGYYSKNNAEPCLLFRKGDPPTGYFKPATDAVSSLVRAPIPKPHSAKPVEVRRRLNLMYPVDRFRCLEGFARETAPGWNAFGQEIDGRDCREVIPELIAHPAPAIKPIYQSKPCPQCGKAPAGVDPSCGFCLHVRNG